MDGLVIGLIVLSCVIFVIAVLLLVSYYTYYRSRQRSRYIRRFDLDPEEYMGTWYMIWNDKVLDVDGGDDSESLKGSVLERMKKDFDGNSEYEKGCKYVKAVYSDLNKAKDKFKILNECEEPDGSTRSIKGTAYGTDNPNVFSVSFFPGIYGNYSVIYYDHDTSVVSNLDLDKMWILHRRPYMSEDARRRLRDKLEKIFVPVYANEIASS